MGVVEVKDGVLRLLDSGRWPRYGVRSRVESRTEGVPYFPPLCVDTTWMTYSMGRSGKYHDSSP